MKCGNKVVALLPIKKVSERVKNKNFRMMCGKPLYKWVLDTLLLCESVKKVVIDTDCELFIRDLNENYPSVETILRPNEIRGNAVSMNKVIAHDISVCEEDEYFLQTHTTNPLITIKTIDSAVNSFFTASSEYDSMFSVNRIQARTYWSDGSPVNHVLDELKPTQELVPIMEENSNIFLFSQQSFNKTSSRIGERPLLFETPRMESFDIDEEEDFSFVSLLLQAMRGKIDD